MGENDFAVVVASVDFESGASSSVLLDLVIILHRRNLQNRLREHSGSVEGIFGDQGFCSGECSDKG